MLRDTLFDQPVFEQGKFCFNKDVVAVFDDMVCRSVPFYHDVLSIMVDIVIDSFGSKDTITIYDLGCSTGNFLKCLLSHKHHNSFFINYRGVDSSIEMLKQLSLISFDSSSGSLQSIHHDLNHDFKFHSMQVCLFNLVLQFINADKRLALLRQCYRALSKGGLCFVIEKIVCDNHDLQSLFTSQYHRFKEKNGYSKDAIKHKDRSLHDVLVPFSLDENKQLLIDSGFKVVHPFFQWFNFSGLLAIKE